MCRHFAYLGPDVPLAELLLDPPHGLYRQSWAPRRQTHGTVNADGFGIGWYPPGTTERDDDEYAPARYRRAVPIWTDPNLPDLARTLHSGAVLAAVRDATPGNGPDEAANAPFSGGRWLFSHNGSVPDWQRLTEDSGTSLPAPMLLGLQAHSDSALLWALVHDRLAAGEPPGGALAAITRLTAAVRPQARLNLLLTDGRSIAAIRWGDSLWYRAAPGRVVVASEPWDDPEPWDAPEPWDDRAGEGWQEVPEHTLLLASPTGVRTAALSPVAARPVAERAERMAFP